MTVSALGPGGPPYIAEHNSGDEKEVFVPDRYGYEIKATPDRQHLEIFTYKRGERIDRNGDGMLDNSLYINGAPRRSGPFDIIEDNGPLELAGTLDCIDYKTQPAKREKYFGMMTEEGIMITCK